MSQTPFPTYHFDKPRGTHAHTQTYVHTQAHSHVKPKKENVLWHIDKSPFWVGAEVRERFGTFCTVTVNGNQVKVNT